MDLADKPYGSSRSIVRRIATSLPLKPCPRVHVQIHPYADSSVNTPKDNGIVASLADVAWIDEDDESFTRSELQPGFIFTSHQRRRFCQPLTRQTSLAALTTEDPEPKSPSLENNEAIQKITVLENELAKLRAQIAQIVLIQEQNTQIAGSGLAPIPAAGAPPPPPPPPPPPLPPPPPSQQPSALDLIKERRGRTASSQSLLDSGPKQPEVPNMLDVLKDMTKVKLRSVKKPEHGAAKVTSSDPMDAASLIAEALKRKFAHRYRSDSQSESDFNIPDKKQTKTETPLFGQHLLKPGGKRNISVSRPTKP
ncbi:mitochondrial fission regulator 1 [Amia ocellicauda]|uniref:mitochondrial fission regulator 1 n=1 Tax=Amia ocellicauda TaxID=2972642 RepID=UPI003464C021